MKPKVVIFGHSHIAIVQEAYQKAVAANTARISADFMQLFGLYHPFSLMVDGKLEYNSELEFDLMEKIRTFDANCIFGYLTGSEHFVWAVQGQSRPFDLVLPDHSSISLIPNAHIVPYNLMYDVIYNQLVNLIKFYGRVSALSGLPVYQILPPPPISDPERLEKWSPEPFHSMIKQHGVPHAAIRYKLWRISISIAKELGAHDGIGLIDTPEESIDSYGMLREEYSGDAVHANLKYGEILLDKISDVTI